MTGSSGTWRINGQALKSWPLYTEIFEADKVINIPIAKHHGLAKLTLSMKNWMGVMGGSRRQIHQKLDESLVDLSMKIKPTLTILDAVRILTANGPQGGSLDDVKKLDTIVVGHRPGGHRLLRRHALRHEGERPGIRDSRPQARPGADGLE